MDDNRSCGRDINGKPCWYPVTICPLHSTPPPRELMNGPAATEREVRNLLIEAARALVQLNGSPAQIGRIMRAVHLLQQLPPTPEEEDRILREVALRGLIMSGLTPRNDDEWALAREVFDDQTIQDIERRARQRPPAYDWSPPADLRIDDEPFERLFDFERT
jgi:hypothetical protein